MLGRSVFVSSLPFAHGESITRFWSVDFFFFRYENILFLNSNQLAFIFNEINFVIF